MVETCHYLTRRSKLYYYRFSFDDENIAEFADRLLRMDTFVEGDGLWIPGSKYAAVK